MPAKPMLDDVELQHVQKVEAEDEQVLAQHGVPALEGDFLQDLGRRVTRMTLVGVMIGTEAGEQLKTLRLKFRNAEPVSFVSDIATATTVDKVLIEEFGVRELAGKPERFEYELTLREFLPPPPPEQEEPPPPPPPPPPPAVETGILVVEVNVAGDPNFDFSKVTLSVEGTKDDGSAFSQTLTNRSENVWTEDPMPLGQFTAKAAVNLAPGAIIATAFVVHFRFDNAFLEPCMREVLKQVAAFADANKDFKLLITGNTDEVGSPTDLTASDRYNQSLSERRARGVFSYLTFGSDAAAAEKDWNALRQKQTALPTLGDKWGARQYQYMLQALGFFPGVIDGDHGPLTDDAVRAFRQAKGLPPGTVVDDDVWKALITDYLKQDTRKIPGQFLPNRADACDSGIIKWLGLASQDPVKNVRTAFRPNRRVELLFVKVEKFPCQEPQPDTFNLPAPGDVNADWCLKPGDPSNRTCFVVKHLPPGGAPKNDQWTRQRAEPGEFTVSGVIKFEDGTPAPNVKYILIAPDAEFMDGEKSTGDGNTGKTKADGTFTYVTKKGIGTYTLEIQDPLIARLEGEPQSAAKGAVVCKRMDGSSPFNVVVRNLNTLVNPIINLASAVVVVKKTYTNPARQAVTVRTDGPFFRSGTLTRVGNAINFFDAAVGGTQITFNGTDNVFTGAQLTAGVQLFAEGTTASVALNDVELTLTLTPGATPVGPPARATMTAVDLIMDMFMSRAAAGVNPAPLPQPPDPAPAPGTGTDKWFGGRFVHQRDLGNHQGRALITIRVQPAAFAGDLALRQVAVAADTPGALDNKVQVFDNEIPGPRQTPPVAEAAKANPHVFNSATIPAGGLRFFVEGNNVSAALRDTGFQLGLSGGEVDGDRVRLTVVRFSNLVAQIPSTPANTNRLNNSPVPNSQFPRVLHAPLIASDFDDDFNANLPVVLVQGSLPAGTLVNLSVVVAPAGVPVSWSTQRDLRPGLGDHPDVVGASPNPLPALNQNPANQLQATLALDAVGSFHIRPFVDCNGTNTFEHNDALGNPIDREPFMVMNLVLIRVGGTIGVGAGATASTNASLAHQVNVNVAPAAPTSASGVVLGTGGFGAPAAAGVHNNATVVVVGGGPTGVRGFGQLFAGWINNVIAMDMVAEYRDPGTGAIHRHITAFASNNPNAAAPLGPLGVFVPVGTVVPAGFVASNAVPAIVAFPILDCANFGNEGTGGNRAVGTGELGAGPGPPPPPAAGTHVGIVRTPLAVGETWQVQMWDSPGFPGFPAHLAFPGALSSFRDNLDFSTDLCFWTNVTGVPGPTPGPITGAVPPVPDANCCLYSSVQTDTWRIRFRVDFNPLTGAGVFTTPASIVLFRDGNPLRLAQAVPAEVRFPIVLRLAVLDARA